MTNPQRVDVARLSELLAKATPGPWRFYEDKLRPQFSLRIMEVQQSNGSAIIPWSGFDSPDTPKTIKRANARLIVAAVNALPALLQQLAELERDNETMRGADYHQAGVEQEQEIIDLESKLAERDAEIADWQNLLTAVIAPRSLPGLSVEYPKLWPFDGGQDAAMVAFALHTAIERAEAAERAREEATELLREVHRNGWGQLTISDLGKAPLLERIAAFLAANGGSDA